MSPTRGFPKGEHDRSRMKKRLKIETARQPSASSLSLKDLPKPTDGKMDWPWSEATCAGPELLSAHQEYPRITVITPSYNQGE